MKDSPGINFAIPIDYVKEFLKKYACMFGRNHIRRCFGIRIEKKEYGEGLFVILEVRKNSPAYLAGIRPGFILTRINNVRVKQNSEDEVNNMLEVERETITVLTFERYSKTRRVWLRVNIEIKLMPRLDCDYQVDMDYI